MEEYALKINYKRKGRGIIIETVYIYILQIYIKIYKPECGSTRALKLGEKRHHNNQNIPQIAAVYLTEDS